MTLFAETNHVYNYNKMVILLPTEHITERFETWFSASFAETRASYVSIVAAAHQLRAPLSANH
jgi:hypothetical protein